MAMYLVGYDLHEGQSYTDLVKAIQTFPNWWHHLDSTWIIQTPMTAVEVRDFLWGHMYSNDKLLIAQYFPASSGGTAAWQGFNGDGGTWLWQNM